MRTRTKPYCWASPRLDLEGGRPAGLGAPPAQFHQSGWRPPPARWSAGEPLPLPSPIGAIFKACFLEATSYWRQRFEIPRQLAGQGDRGWRKPARVCC